MLFARAATRAQLDSFVDAEISDLLGEVMGPAAEVAVADSDCFAASGTADFWSRRVVECLG